MAWIKMYSETTESAKLLDLANRLEVNEPHAIGLLAFLWAFTERNAWQTGDLGRWTDAVIAKKCGWEGNPAMFIQALQLSGWLDPDSKKVHEWTEHQTDLIRMRSRNLNKPSSDKVRTNSELSTDKVPAREDKRREEEIREEKRRVETTLTSTPKPAASQPQEPKRQAFVKPTLAELQAYIAEKGYSVDPEAFLAHYISNGWKVGSNPMKDWRAAVVTWQKKQTGGQYGSKTRGVGGAAPVPGKYADLSK